MLLHDPAVVGLVKQRLDRCLERARALISLNRRTVEAVADRLAETGYLDRAGIETMLIKYPVLSTSSIGVDTP
jgi:ATP-dependent Zn protease